MRALGFIMGAMVTIAIGLAILFALLGDVMRQALMVAGVVVGFWMVFAALWAIYITIRNHGWLKWGD